MRQRCSITRGFTLIELVVVVMILGILAAIAAPKLLDTSKTAVDNSVRRSLQVIRDAIDNFTSEHTDTLPGADGNENTFKTDLAKYLRGSDFPGCPVAAKNNAVRMMTGGGGPLTGLSGTEATDSWVYDFSTGTFSVNSNAVSTDGTTTYDQF